MWMIVAREPKANAPQWTGRRWLAFIDALAWPLFWVLLLGQIDMPFGIVGPMVVAIAFLFSAERIHRAVWVNHRYWFSTWRWGRVVAVLIAIGLVLKMAAGQCN
jgi:ribose/xylose/arabinose/galactoside ABC-type transport system permease subunit